MIKKILIIIFCFFSADTLYAKYSEELISENALTLLNRFKTVSTDKNIILPPDVSLLFADVKYDGKGSLKICEFGGIEVGGTYAPMEVNGKKELLIAPCWDLFWHYLKRDFNKPIWYVGAKKPSVIKELNQVDGKLFENLQEFESYIEQNLPKRVGAAAKVKPTKMSDCDGILVLRQPVGAAVRRQLLKKNPRIILVNAYTKRFTGKHHFFSLFTKNPELSDMMPRWKVYKKNYTSTLAHQIMNDVPADFYIIKPMKGILSRGVIMVRKEELDNYLKLILKKQNKIKKTLHKNYQYWKEDTGENFFVQAYAPSKTIIQKDKQYDPTMRLVFFMSHDQGQIKVNVIAGHWKIPSKSLNDQATLTEQHITQPFLGDFFTGIMIAPEDFKKAKGLMENMLAPIYLKMLEQRDTLMPDIRVFDAEQVHARHSRDTLMLDDQDFRSEHMLSSNALSLLSQVTHAPIKGTFKLPADITFLCVDLKFNGSEVKICEFGGMHANVRVTETWINGQKESLTTPYWDLFWQYLTQFKKPIWYVGKQKPLITRGLAAVGGKTFKSMKEFGHYIYKNYPGYVASSLELRSPNAIGDQGKIQDYMGILVVNEHLDMEGHQEASRLFPKILLVNEFTKKFAQKHHAFQLFEQNPVLKDQIPYWKMYKKKYSSSLAAEIAEEIKADFYIIKPIKGVRSQGVLMIAKEDLDNTLKTILTEEPKKRKPGYQGISHWKKDEHTTFFVQAYVPSKKIMVRGKTYDPTMRVFFFLSHDNGIVTVNPLAGYWKIPSKSLDEGGTLTEKHITHPYAGEGFSGLTVDEGDLEQVKKLMSGMLPLLYSEMLHYDKGK